MKLRVGRIPFLVCAPFFHIFLGRENEFPDIDFIDGAPSAHCAGLKEGSIHLSPASSITYAQKENAFVLSPTLCTSCSFEVRSVKLFSQFPIQELNEKRIRLTSQSKTSVSLLRVLMELHYQIKPNYIQGFAADENDDACLLIGDLALEENERHRFAYSYDLGTLWQEWQGLPFVFGAWVIAKEALKPELRPILDKYLQQTEQSLNLFRKEPSLAINHWRAKYPVNLPQQIIEDYYKNIDYHFTEERKKSLELFFMFAKKINLIEKAPQLEFL